MFIFSGSGGGWNTTLSLSTDFSQIWNSFKEIANRTQPTGFSSDNRYSICGLVGAQSFIFSNSKWIVHYLITYDLHKFLFRSWIGGMPCSPESTQYGGFGGGGAGCYGGGGGGGFIGGIGGTNETTNGQGIF